MNKRMKTRKFSPFTPQRKFQNKIIAKFLKKSNISSPKLLVKKGTKIPEMFKIDPSQRKKSISNPITLNQIHK